MTKEIEMTMIMINNRIHKLKGSDKNIKCPGILRKLNRKLRKLEAENNEN